jgi:type I restriction enzyme S subunit
MNSNIPKHWVEPSLGDLFSTTSGGTPSRTNKNYYSGSIPWVKSGELKDSKILSAEEHITSEAIENSSAKIFPQGTILIALYGANIGKLGVLGVNAATNQAVCAIFTSKFVQDSFLFFYLLSQRENIIKLGFGAAQPNISQQTIRDLPFPLPPLNEQKRIGEKLDAILPKVKNAKARLENIPKIVNKFRQSVLADACSGKLTEEWREGKELPEWEDKKLGEFIINIEAGKSLKCIEIPPKENEIGIVKVSAVSWGSFMENESKTLPKNVEYNDKWLISKGDFLFSRANTTELVGACVVVEKIKLNLLLSDKTLRFLLNNSLNSHWLMYFLRCSRGRDQIESLATGNQPAMKNISQGKIKEIIIPLPPIEEQHEIVRRVEKLFAIANSLEEKYKTAIARVEKIEQSVLAKAFRGELVDPDPSDEPAENLLKRILAVRAKDFSPLRKPKPKKRASYQSS